MGTEAFTGIPKGGAEIAQPFMYRLRHSIGGLHPLMSRISPPLLRQPSREDFQSYWVPREEAARSLFRTLAWHALSDAADDQVQEALNRIHSGSNLSYRKNLTAAFNEWRSGEFVVTSNARLHYKMGSDGPIADGGYINTEYEINLPYVKRMAKFGFIGVILNSQHPLVQPETTAEYHAINYGQILECTNPLLRAHFYLTQLKNGVPLNETGSEEYPLLNQVEVERLTDWAGGRI